MKSRPARRTSGPRADTGQGVIPRARSRRGVSSRRCSREGQKRFRSPRRTPECVSTPFRAPAPPPRATTRCPGNPPHPTPGSLADAPVFNLFQAAGHTPAGPSNTGRRKGLPDRGRAVRADKKKNALPLTTGWRAYFCSVVDNRSALVQVSLPLRLRRRRPLSLSPAGPAFCVVGFRAGRRTPRGGP